jgi:ABC-type polysaccharide/polyol phosphate transport system ATPase subunit
MQRAIEVEGLGKRYRLGEGFHRYQTVRDVAASALRRSRNGPAAELEVWALRDVSFTVDQGDVVGVIGRNGAGKTTLLKILARITEPTTGVSRTRGRVRALLEVGTGFHPELTGRENIYLNGAVLGMTRQQIRKRFDEIVAFAEVERFLDTPLKRYSAGMYLRLAFGVAAHLEPQIVVVDEVLAVGDGEFQRKCVGRMSQFGSEGRTVLFVSHDLGAISQLCPRTIWLDHGVVKADGPTDRSLELYLKSSGPQALRRELSPEGGGPIQLLSVAVADRAGSALDAPRRDEPLSLQLRFKTTERVPALDLGLYLVNGRGVRVLEEYWSDAHPGKHPADEPGEYEASVTFPPILPAGDYVVGVWIGSTYDELRHREVLRFRLLPGMGDRQETLERRRAAQPPLEWRVRPRTREGAPFL